MTRAISTVLDVSVCLLLVSASVFTLVGTPSADDGSDRSDSATADETADVLAATTAQVTYEVGDETRTAHDTLAGLLATAAVASARTGDSGGVSTGDFERAVAERVNRTLRRSGGAQVVARAESEGDSRIVTGATPPADANVHAAGFSVPSGPTAVRLTVRTWSR